jgi:hypothetical protein
MDLSKLDQNEKLALYAAIVVVLAGLLSAWGGLLYLSILAALAAAVVLFLPQLSPNTALPGSRGTLLAALGIIAVVAAAIELLIWFGYTLETLATFRTLMFLLALVASAVMAWAGWRALQGEGGRWQLGTRQATGAAAAAAPAPSPSAPEPAAPPPAPTETDVDEDRPREA